MQTARARINAVATALPPHVLHQEVVADRAGEIFLGPAFERMRGIYSHADIRTRHSCVPIDWYMEEHGLQERNRLYIENAVILLETAARRALDRAGLAAADLGGIAVVSTTGLATPSLDALLIERMQLPRDIQRLPIFGLGCAGGVLGLARTAALAAASPGQAWLFLVVELCGLTFRACDNSKSNVIATALFGDGAAACILCTEGEGPAVAAAGEHTFADSLDVMGWEIVDDGLKVLFSRDIPGIVRKEIGELARRFLARRDLTLGDIGEFVCHPGGAKVLDALEDVFEVQRGGLVRSREVLRRYGNMSAVTVLFVLEDSLGEGHGGLRLLTSLGPGFTAAFLLLEGA